MFSIFEAHLQQRGRLRLLLTAPFIYGMIIPLVIMDVCTTIYQAVSFPAFGIPRVPRKRYVQRVRRGTHLRLLDRFHCAYCSYANGVCAYLRAVLIETEKYWCPIKYALRAGMKAPHPQSGYAEDGELDELKTVLKA